MSDERPHVELFTDGACSGNPGPGGWAYIIRHTDSGQEREFSDGAASTTNNRMELTSVIEGLKALDRPSVVDLYSDSQYVVKGLSTWIDDWKARGWKRSGKSRVKNLEMWQELDRLREIHELRCHWVKGHDDHPENERCDRLAVAAVDRYRTATC
ncbi:MAG: ribonuclease HI [Planctomycetota bacterium]